MQSTRLMLTFVFKSTTTAHRRILCTENPLSHVDEVKLCSLYEGLMNTPLTASSGLSSLYAEADRRTLWHNRVSTKTAMIVL